MELKPAPGKIAIQFIDDLEEKPADTGSVSPGAPQSPQTLVAVVVGVGAEVKGLKKGDTILVHDYARDGAKIDSKTVVTDHWCWIATITD